MKNEEEHYERVFEQGTLQFDAFQGTFESKENKSFLLSRNPKPTLEAWMLIKVAACFNVN
jgi:hypothetical protein